MKACRKCGRRLRADDFYKMKDRKNFPTGRDCVCKECRRAQKRETYRRLRKKEDGMYIGRGGKVVEHKGNATRLYWSDMKLNDLRMLYPYHKNEWLAVHFDVSQRTVVRKARELGLEKNEEWLRMVWSKNRDEAHFVNKIQGIKYDREQLLRAGMKTRITSDKLKQRTHEQRHEIMLKAWETRRKNMVMKRAATI